MKKAIFLGLVGILVVSVLLAGCGSGEKAGQAILTAQCPTYLNTCKAGCAQTNLDACTEVADPASGCKQGEVNQALNKASQCANQGANDAKALTEKTMATVQELEKKVAALEPKSV